MTQNEFRAKCYEILEKHGHIEQNGTLYYSEAAIMDLIEWLKEMRVEVEENKLQNTVDDLKNFFQNLF